MVVIPASELKYFTTTIDTCSLLLVGFFNKTELEICLHGVYSAIDEAKLQCYEATVGVGVEVDAPMLAPDDEKLRADGSAGARAAFNDKQVVPVGCPGVDDWGGVGVDDGEVIVVIEELAAGDDGYTCGSHDDR
jgi:hypothetical protein